MPAPPRRRDSTIIQDWLALGCVILALLIAGRVLISFPWWTPS
jgi:hypothetical protein